MAQRLEHSSERWQIPIQILSPSQGEGRLELVVSHIPDEYPNPWAKSYEAHPLHPLPLAVLCEPA